MKTFATPLTWLGRLRGGRLSGFGKFGRFLVVGIANGAAGFVLFLFFFTVLGLHFLVANVLVFVTWAWFGFELQRRWTFRAANSGVSFVKFLGNQIVFLGLSSLLMWTLVQVLTVRAEFAYVLTLGIVAVGIYLSSLFWVFGGPDTSHKYGVPPQIQ